MTGDLTISDTVELTRGASAGAGFGLSIAAGTGAFSHLGGSVASLPTFHSRQSGDAQDRWLVLANGTMRIGDGAVAPSWELSFVSADTVTMGATDVLRCQVDPVDGNDLTRRSWIEDVIYTITDGSVEFFEHEGGPTPNSVVFQSAVTGDAQPRFQIRADGDHLWGDGSGGLDTTLVRASANTLAMGAGDTIQIPQDPVASDDLARKVYVDNTARNRVQQYVTATGTTNVNQTTQTVVSDATTGNQDLDLPASPTAGHHLNVTKRDATANTVTIDGNGKNINGAATMVLTSQYEAVTIEYNDDVDEWMIL